MSDASGSTWWGRATALTLGDLRKDAFVRDTRSRAVGRLVAVVAAVAVVIILAIFSLGEEPSLRSRTYTYRVAHVGKLPSGKHILGTYCPCTQDALLWNAFVAWPRFSTTGHRDAAAAYCARLRNVTGTATLADAAPVTSTPAPAAGRRLHQAVNTTTTLRIQSNVLQQGCSAWVQDIIISLDPANVSYQAEAYTAMTLRSQASVRTALRLWLVAKLKNHLQAQYRVAAAVFGAGAGTPLPESFAELLKAAAAQLDSIITSTYSDISQTLYYDRYVNLCRPRHCDVTATKPQHAYAIDGIARVGGLCTLVLLMAVVLWRLVTLLPFLRERDAAYTDLK